MVLIHGTFARRAPWTGFDSRIAKTVGAHGDLVRFLWSDKNSMRTRRIATEKLQECIHELVGKGYKRVCLIGHSHGGNIALKACEDKAVSAHVASIVCMATPFLHAWRPQIRFARGLNVRIAVFFGALLAPGLAAVLWQFKNAQVLVQNAPDAAGAYLNPLPYSVAVILMACALWLSSKMPSSEFQQDLHGDISGSVCDPGAIQHLVERTLILSHSGDEADGSLKIASMLNRYLVTQLNMDFFGRWKREAAGKPIIVTEDRRGIINRPLRSLVFGQVRLIASLSNLAFGADGLASGNNVFLASSETPKGKWHHWQFTGDDLRGTNEILYHSVLYDNPEVTAVIDDWVRETCAPA